MRSGGEGIRPVTALFLRARRCGYRMASSMRLTKIFPSPMRPVRAAPTYGLHGAFLQIVDDNQLDFDLGQKVDRVFAASVELGVSLLPSVAAGFENWSTCLPMPASSSASLTASSLEGWRMASILSMIQNASLDSVTGGAGGCAVPVYLLKQPRPMGDRRERIGSGVQVIAFLVVLGEIEACVLVFG